MEGSKKRVLPKEFYDDLQRRVEESKKRRRDIRQNALLQDMEERAMEGYHCVHVPGVYLNPGLREWLKLGEFGISDLQEGRVCISWSTTLTPPHGDL
jgi:hypothetical protein